jgi:hypothetical protein
MKKQSKKLEKIPSLNIIAISLKEIGVVDNPNKVIEAVEDYLTKIEETLTSDFSKLAEVDNLAYKILEKIVPFTDSKITKKSQLKQTLSEVSSLFQQLLEHKGLEELYKKFISFFNKGPSIISQTHIGRLIEKIAHEVLKLNDKYWTKYYEDMLGRKPRPPVPEYLKAYV